MASPDDYIRAAGGRRSTASQFLAVDNALAPAEASVAPLREASPEEDDAQPVTDRMISRSAESAWLPGRFIKSITRNDDETLERTGGDLKLWDALLDDDVAFSTFQQRRLAITSRDWEVSPGDDKDPRSVKAADDFRAMLKGVGFDNVTGGLHFAIWYGYAIGEALWTIKEHDGRPIVWLSDIVIPDRRWFAFTVEGELRFVNDLFGSGVEGQELPANKFLTIRTGGTHDFAFYGRGLAHWCYWPIFFKRAALKFWALYLEKFGMPTVAVEFTEAQKNDIAVKASLLEAGVAIGQDRVVLVPEGTLTQDRLKLIEAERSGAGAASYDVFVEAQNEALMRVVLGQPGTSKGVSSGLNSNQASEHADVKSEIVKADSDLISDGINRTYAKWVTRWNYGPDVAPPTVFRILDDPEDVDTIADRDVKLDGIGIKRTDESIAEVYGAGYERVEEPPAPTPAELAAAAAGAKPANKIAEFAAQGGETAFSPLYISRQLTNAREVIAWAKAQGIAVTVPPEDMHVTVLYSKTPVDWFKMAGEGWDSEQIVVQKGGPRFVEKFGDALVLRFAEPSLRWRHDTMIERGASSDYDDYKPHVTLSYDAGDLDLAAIEPFAGELRFGPEIFEPIKEPDGDPTKFAFSAAEDDAIDRLIASAAVQGASHIEKVADAFRDSLQGVSTAEGARVAILGVVEQFSAEDWARELALPLVAERGASVVGAEGDVVG